ncbi:MAG: hypothetical protein EA401_08975 [Planctomycetota bacterium]|nr:MAG: hypothetical protein EA401_08975 [Planctomycetota bacterium]
MGRMEPHKMALPLQPALRPAPPWLQRVLLLACLSCAVLFLGWCQQAWQQPPRLLHNNSGEDNFVATVERAIDEAGSRVWVMLFVLRQENQGSGPVTRLVQALARAKDRGVDVQVVLDQSMRWDSDEIERKHFAAQEWLSHLGVPVLIDSLEQRTHAKTLLIDHDTIIVGSHNWTFSALSRNVELSLKLRSRRLAQQTAEHFHATPGWQERRSPP